MAIYISVVSHGHYDLIQALGSLPELAKEFHIVIKSNVPGESFGELEFLENVHIIKSDFYLGFGHNNNIAFNYCKYYLSMSENDYFVVLNPDVIINSCDVIDLVKLMKMDECQLASINLFKDYEFAIPDLSVRKFPKLFDFFASFLHQGNSSILDKSHISEPCVVDWAAGSFLVFTASLYQTLRGFDQGYFMYCEDIDICLRSFKKGFPMRYYPQIRAIHLAKHANRKLLSKHFYWHFCSALRFILVKKGLLKPISII